jgi:glycosyltransferase involved in cell wall biosynthesis
MSAADALILPSVIESFGLVMLEAMASGCMVLASDADGPRSILKAPWGTIMNFRDPRNRVGEIERGILELLSLSRDEINARGEEARADSRQYTWKKCAEAHASVLEEARLINANRT